MAAETGLTTKIGQALSIDLVTQFGNRMKTLQELIGIERVMPLESGSLIKTYTSSVTLDGSTIAPGDIIPLSEVKVEPGPSHELVWDKKRKAITMEDIQRYGFESAVSNTDKQLVNQIQKDIRTKLINQLATGTGSSTGSTLQEVFAENWAAVKTAFEEDEVEVVSFINPFDVSKYLSNSEITTQNAFGMTYFQDFLANRIIFMSGDIPKGTVYSTAANNLVFAYANMDNGVLGQTFNFTTDSTGVIGVTHDVNLQRLQAETVAAYGIIIFAERLDGVIVGKVTPPVPAG